MSGDRIMVKRGETRDDQASIPARCSARDEACINAHDPNTEPDQLFNGTEP